MLDDFGTGYSSLGYLHHYPIDKIKIDRVFVRNMGPNAKYDAIVSAIVGMARALDIEVMAEGVESEIQHAGLAAAGCSDYQGFLFAKPMPLEVLLAELDQTWRDGPALVEPKINARCIKNSARRRIGFKQKHGVTSSASGEMFVPCDLDDGGIRRRLTVGHKVTQRHRTIGKDEAAGAGSLDLVHGAIGEAPKRRDVGGVVGKYGDADTGAAGN